MKLPTGRLEKIDATSSDTFHTDSRLAYLGRYRFNHRRRMLNDWRNSSKLARNRIKNRARNSRGN